MACSNISFSSGDVHRLSEVRIVLLGCRAAGKSSTGNIILGRQGFDLRGCMQCVVRQGDVAARKITVVEAPGWQTNKAVKQLLKQEIVLSMSMCPPGPHAVLLVMSLDSKSWESVINDLTIYMKFLTESVWGHSIILFTFGDRIKDQNIEQYIESNGKALHRLIEKCGNRYQVFDNNNKNDHTQVTELLEKIEKMVAGNRGRHLEMDRDILGKEERKKVENKSKEMRMKASMKRESFRKDTPIHRLSEVKIVLLGQKNAGKSSSRNTILGKDTFKSNQSVECVTRHGNAAERKITVIEAPGWETDALKSHHTVLHKQKIMQSVSMCSPGPDAVLLVLPLYLKFTEKERNTLDSYLDLFRTNIWSHTMVLFTFGDSLGDTTIERYIESEGPALQGLVEKCKNRYHVFNNKKQDDDSQVIELLEKIDEMVEEKGGCSSKMGTMSEYLQKRWLSEERKGSSLSFHRGLTYGTLRRGSQLQDLEHTGYLKERSVHHNPTFSLQTPFTSLKQHNILTSDESSSIRKDIQGYRFLQLQAGQFMCKFSDLIFEMSEEGEVMYRVASWNSVNLNELCRMEPAGPLYSIECPKGSIHRLHFPHCETQTDGVELAVAHVTGGNVEIIQPHKVTDTHVIIGAQHLSLFGILKAFSARRIRAQVLLFFEKRKTKLNIHLLPGNVPVEEVQKIHGSNTYIMTSSKCRLTPGKKYRPFCGPTDCNFVCQPEDESFDRDYGPNYHPTFEVFFDTMVDRVTLRLLDENDKVVWKPRTVLFTGTQKASTSWDSLVVGADFVDRHRQTLIQRVSSVMEIADRLKDKEMITGEMYSMINAGATSQGKMRELYKHLDSETVKAEFYQILCEKQRHLVTELESGSDQD